MIARGQGIQAWSALALARARHSAVHGLRAGDERLVAHPWRGRRGGDRGDSRWALRSEGHRDGAGRPLPARAARGFPGCGRSWPRSAGDPGRRASAHRRPRKPLLGHRAAAAQGRNPARPRRRCPRRGRAPAAAGPRTRARARHPLVRAASGPEPSPDCWRRATKSKRAETWSAACTSASTGFETPGSGPSEGAARPIRE